MGLCASFFSLVYNKIVCLYQFLLENKKIFSFSFLKSIKKAQSTIERQQEINISYTNFY